MLVASIYLVAMSTTLVPEHFLSTLFPLTSFGRGLVSAVAALKIILFQRLFCSEAQLRPSRELCGSVGSGVEFV